ncbi:craniofacial development protein 2-like [Orbicella faveolata]|uniref:craniofacial development protein 2-like n=1 Tax=Orbicella faveolata TaxID=48498 RepID=UPI0009E57466|nr:craniofacial development protein 2-like [Orbicella faveolata]
MDKLPRRDLKILMGDLRAKVGADNTNRELVMGKHGVGVQNENGELLTEFCTFNDLVIAGTVFQHKQIHKTTRTSPDGRTVNQIDHITIGRKRRRSLLDVRVKRGADAASDHHLVVADLKVKLKVYRDRVDRPSHKYNIHSLKDKTKAEIYQCELRNRFSALAHQPEESVEEKWRGLRDTWKATCNKVLGKKTR